MLEGPEISHQTSSVEKLVVILHGYGADGDNLIDLAHHWSGVFPQTDFLAPNGPEVCEINPMGYQWFGLKDFSPFNVRAGLDRTGPLVAEFLRKQLKKRQLNPSDLVVVGFSQGCMLALEMLFMIPGLGGVIGYSGAFYPPVAGQPLASPPPVMLVHGMVDLVVPFQALNESERQLKSFNIIPQTHAIPSLGHGIDMTGIQLGEQFFSRIFTKSQNFSRMAQ